MEVRGWFCHCPQTNIRSKWGFQKDLKYENCSPQWKWLSQNPSVFTVKFKICFFPICITLQFFTLEITRYFHYSRSPLLQICSSSVSALIFSVWNTIPSGAYFVSFLLYPLFHSTQECVNQHKWSQEPTKFHWWPHSIQTVAYLCLFSSSYIWDSYSHITEFSLLPHHCSFKSLKSHCKKPTDVELSR